MMMGGLFDIRSQFARYGEYHCNAVNVAIHLVFVPTIMWCTTSLVATLWPAPLAAWPGPVQALVAAAPGPDPVLDVAAALLLAYNAFYVLLEPVAGLLAAPLLYAALASGQHVARAVPDAWHYTLALFVVAWIAQFVGHGVYERRAPALLDNLVQALVMAPFFVFLEVLFAAGYRPALRRELRNEVGRRVAAFRRARPKTA
ncbi:hypothetical protein H4R18_003018 [Coemansia javaensis]|uniref:DUF962 domain-containing protein n=1 Tax=Coemansia javaensis TaxID=2761396 RepID=A0A9W8HBJ0_9FUNG|nr:hypothetical protein H4R18_003018 [Coemansia javaensis]